MTASFSKSTNWMCSPAPSFYKKNRHYRSKVSGGLLESDLRENVEEILD